MMPQTNIGVIDNLTNNQQESRKVLYLKKKCTNILLAAEHQEQGDISLKK